MIVSHRGREYNVSPEALEKLQFRVAQPRKPRFSPEFRLLEVRRRLLLGEMGKCIAIDLGIAPQQVSHYKRQLLKAGLL